VGDNGRGQTFVLGREKGVQSVDIARGELVERELDAMIERRSRQKDPDEASELWQESVRRYNARKREENRLAWCGYFERLATSLRSRAEEYDDRAQALLEDETS
jgi:hypothetical protein